MLSGRALREHCWRLCPSSRLSPAGLGPDQWTSQCLLSDYGAIKFPIDTVQSLNSWAREPRHHVRAPSVTSQGPGCPRTCPTRGGGGRARSGAAVELHPLLPAEAQRRLGFPGRPEEGWGSLGSLGFLPRHTRKTVGQQARSGLFRGPAVSSQRPWQGSGSCDPMQCSGSSHDALPWTICQLWGPGGIPGCRGPQSGPGHSKPSGKCRAAGAGEGLLHIWAF